MKELKINHTGINYLSKCHLNNSGCNLITLTFVLFDEAEAEIPTWKQNPIAAEKKKKSNSLVF